MASRACSTLGHPEGKAKTKESSTVLQHEACKARKPQPSHFTTRISPIHAVPQISFNTWRLWITLSLSMLACWLIYCTATYHMPIHITVFPWFLPTLELIPHRSARWSWRKLTPPSNSSRMVTQLHSFLATRTTWTTQITCLAGLYSRTVLHCTYLVFVTYKESVMCILMVHVPLERTPD